MKHSFLAEAEAEYLDAVRFYEGRQPGLGAAFMVSFPRAAWECRFGALRQAPQRGANGFPRGAWEPGHSQVAQ